MWCAIKTVKYNTFVVYSKDSRLNKGSYLQMGLIKRLNLKKESNKGFHNHLVLSSAHLWIWCLI